MSKHQKKKGKRFPRSIEITVKKPITVNKENGVFLKIKNGNAFLCDKYGHRFDEDDIEVVTTFQGERKQHIVQRATGLSGDVRSADDIIKNYDIIFAADTNTIQFPEIGANCSAGVVYKCEIHQTSELGGELQCKPYRLIRWIWNAEIAIENITWLQAIKEIQKEESSEQRIGLVVDSDLGHIEEYNNRTLPLAEDFYLPDNFTLIYGSADYTDTWINKIIRLCDKEASGQLKIYKDELNNQQIEQIPQGEIRGIMTLLVGKSAE